MILLPRDLQQSENQTYFLNFLKWLVNEWATLVIQEIQEGIVMLNTFI